MNDWERFNDQFREDEDERNARLRRKRKARSGTMAAAEWNQAHRPGIGVTVKMDDGRLVWTRTRSEAWELGSGQPVVMVEGISGGYDLSRVTPMEVQDTPLA